MTSNTNHCTADRTPWRSRARRPHLAGLLIACVLVVSIVSAKTRTDTTEIEAGQAPITASDSALDASTTVSTQPTTTPPEVPTTTHESVPNPATTWQRYGSMPDKPHGAGWAAEGIRDIACPSSETCIAVGYSRASNGDPTVGDVLRSTDAGATWTSVKVGPEHSAYVSIECPTTTACLVGGAEVSSSVILYSVDAGATWSNADIPPDRGLTITGISCAKADACMAARPIDMGSADLLASVDGGRTWTSRPAGYPEPFTAGVNCVPMGPCVVSLGHYSYPEAEFLITDDLGATWEPVTVPQNTHWLGVVDCVSSSTCLALGTTYEYLDRVMTEELEFDQVGEPELVYSNAVYSTKDGGKSWTRTESNLDSVTPITGLQCTNPESCFAINSNLSTSSAIVATNDGGRTWSLAHQASAGNILNAITCFTASRCFAVGGGPLDVTRPALLLVTDGDTSN